MSDEECVEIEISLLQRAGLPGWDETKMELLDKANSDISDALSILGTFKEEPDTHGVGHHRLTESQRLRRLVVERLTRARERVAICHNELDCEREGIQPIKRD